MNSIIPVRRLRKKARFEFFLLKTIDFPEIFAVVVVVFIVVVVIVFTVFLVVVLVVATAVVAFFSSATLVDVTDIGNDKECDSWGAEIVVRSRKRLGRLESLVCSIGSSTEPISLGDMAAKLTYL